MATTAQRPVRALSIVWLDRRMLFGITLVVASVLAGLYFWGATRETEPIVVATSSLPAGHVLGVSDLTVATVKLDGPLAAMSIPGADLTSLVGQTLAGSVHAGEMVLWPDLTSGTLIGPNEVGITIPVAAESVYAGLQPGHEVAVLATRDIRTPNSQTITLLERAVIFEMAREPGRLAVSRTSDSDADERSLINVTLVVPRAEAERVAHAVINWEITLAILPPEPGER